MHQKGPAASSSAGSSSSLGRPGSLRPPLSSAAGSSSSGRPLLDLLSPPRPALPRALRPASSLASLLPGGLRGRRPSNAPLRRRLAFVKGASWVAVALFGRGGRGASGRAQAPGGFPGRGACRPRAAAGFVGGLGVAPCRGFSCRTWLLAGGHPVQYSLINPSPPSPFPACCNPPSFGGESSSVSVLLG